MAEHDNDDARRRFYSQLTAFDTVVIAGGVVLFLVMLFAMMAWPSAEDRFLSPPLVGVAAVILMWPLRQQRAVRALLLSGGLLLLVWFLDKLSGVLAPFIFVYVLAYLFNPAVTWLRGRYRVPRWLSSLMTTALVVGLLALFILLIVPNIVNELRVLATRILESVQHLREWLETSTVLDRLEATGFISKEEFNRRFSAFIQEQAESLAAGIPNAAQGVVQSIGSLLGLATTVAVIPVLLYYTLKDYPYIQGRLIELFPTFGGRRDYLVKAGSIVGDYLRGQLIISGISAFNVSVALILLDVPFALLIGILSGILNMIPHIGIIITNIIAVLIAVIFGDPWLVDVVKVLAVLMAQSLLEQSILTPNILGYKVGLHPVLILLSLFAFGYFLGIFGLLIAVPTTAIIMTIYKAYRDDLSLELASAPTRRPGRLFRRRKRSATERTPETPDGQDAPTEKADPDRTHS